MTVFVNLDQRTPEWFAWRLNGITATESPMIAGISPYCSAWHLWGEKTGKLKPHEVSDYAVRDGVRFESTALNLWCQKHDELALPACCEYEPDRKYRASCDGLPASGEPVEIKCFGKEHLREISQYGLDAPCIAHCVMQVHHQIMVCEAQKGTLVFYDPDSEEKIHEFEIVRDEAVIKGIKVRGDEFWSYVESRKEPPYPRDYYIPRGAAREEWALLAREFKEHEEVINRYTAEIEAHQARLAELSEKFKALMPDDQNRAEFSGMSVLKVVGRGVIDYRKAYEDLPESVRKTPQELERYRKESTVRWDIKSTDLLVPEDVVDESLVEPMSFTPRKSLWF